MDLLKILEYLWQLITNDAIICGVIANIIFLFLTTTFIEKRKEKRALLILKDEIRNIYNVYCELYYFLIKYFKIYENDVFAYDSRIQYCKHINSYYYFIVPKQFYNDIIRATKALEKIKKYSCFALLPDDMQFICSYVEKEVIFLYSFACTVIEGKANARGGVYEHFRAMKNHITEINKSAMDNKITLYDNQYYDLSDKELKEFEIQYDNFNMDKSITYPKDCNVMKGMYMVYNKDCNFK